LGAGLLSVIALAAGVHLGWIGSAGGRSAAFKWIRTGVGIVCICLAGAIIWYAMPGEPVKWTPYSAKVLEQAKESGKPVILDFYADWCPGCRHMDRVTFHDRTIIQASEKGFDMIKVDFSQRGNSARESLAHSYNIVGIPCVIFLKPGGEERADLRVSEVMPPSQFLERMNQL